MKRIANERGDLELKERRKYLDPEVWDSWNYFNEKNHGRTDKYLFIGVHRAANSMICLRLVPFSGDEILRRPVTPHKGWYGQRKPRVFKKKGLGTEAFVPKVKNHF